MKSKEPEKEIPDGINGVRLIPKDMSLTFAKNGACSARKNNRGVKICEI